MWLQSNIFDYCNESETLYLLLELRFLKDILPEQYKQELKKEYLSLSRWIDENEADSKISEYEKISMYGQGVEQKLFIKNMKERHQNLRDLYLITFLVSRSESSKINIVRALYFFLCLKMVELTDYESRIKTTLDECRFLTNNIREFLVPFLPDIAQFDSLKGLQKYLIEVQGSDHYTRWLNRNPQTFEYEIQKYRNKILNRNTLLFSSSARNELNERIAKYLYEYILPIENFFKNDSGITRVTSTTYEIVTGPSHYDDTTGNTISDIANIFESTNHTDAFEAGERQDNESECFEQITIDAPSNYYSDLVKAEGQLNSRRKNTMNQVTDVNVAHKDEIKRLIEYIASKLSSLDFESIDAQYEYEHEYKEKKFRFNVSDESALYLYMILRDFPKNCVTAYNPITGE